MHNLALLMLLAIAGCVPTTDLIQDGHYTIQLTQSRNVWGQNVVHETRCLNTEKIDGFCAPHKGVSGSSHVVAGPGPEIAKGVLDVVGILGGAAILSNGLKHQNVSQPSVNRIFPDSSISTFNNRAEFVPIR